MRRLLFALLIFAFSMGFAFAQGAEFFENPFIGAFVQSEATTCIGFVYPPVDDINDFVRFNPNGDDFIKIAEHPAVIEVIDASGVSTHGVGKMNANWHGFYGGRNRQAALTINGFLADGSKVFCSFKRNAKGVVQKQIISVY